MIVGIDLGTTNSLVGAFVDGEPRLFPNPSGELLTPSAVSVDQDGGVIVGAGARDRIITHPGQSVSHFKRWMGSARETALGGRSFRAEQLSALVLKSLIADAAAATGSEVTEAVISVPAYFSDAQRSATRIAGELAGIRVERLVNEPTAAALAYGLQERGEGRFLVFDLGGGTLDVSIIEMFEGVIEVHATAGDNFLGGEDFLDVLVAAAAKDLHLDVETLPPVDRAILRRRLESLKACLGPGAAATMEVRLGGRDLRWSIGEAGFSSLAEPLIQRLRAPLERSLRDANLSPDDLDEVVLVGGASRMPLVLRTVSRLLGRLPLRHVDPDRAVALGAAVAAGLKARDAKLDEVILTDVCPYTLGIDISKRDASGALHHGFYLPIIDRSSTVPVSRENEVWPVHEDQKVLEFDVYQGENPIAAKNIRLGTIAVPLPPGGTADERGVKVRFTYDINGLLQAEFTVKATGERSELLLQQNPGALTPDQIRERLAALAGLKVHPRDRQENLALIARAERLYEERLAERERLQAMIVAFRSTLDGQDDRLIARTRRAFGEALNAIEPA